MSVEMIKRRNIGISAHIDSGKTTLTERILFYTNRIHAIHEVRGKDGVGAKMDSMDLERERGITIQSAATHCEWKDHQINIIDTPGHVDFTVEVERALRVLDGAILVLCSVAGVQSQSITVDRQMRRYSVPRLAFVNKCDRSGANPFRVTAQLREKLNLNSVLLQIPIGLEEAHAGMIDLVEMRAMTFHGESGQEIHVGPIPAQYAAQAVEYREIMLDAVSMFSDALTEEMLEENVQVATLKKAIHDATVSLQLCPVLLGSAYKNRGVQPLLDAVVDYLPDPTQVTNEAYSANADGDSTEEKVVIPCDPAGPLLAYAFKLEDGRYGQLTYLRVYGGTLRRDDTIFNQRNRKKAKVGRLVRMHSDEMEDITEGEAGDIVALFGIDCHSGDTFTDGTHDLAMTSMHVPTPVISVSIAPIDNKAQINMSKALNRFTKEDPTFRVHVDPETNETIISGMGELHLEVYVERMRREYAAEVITSPPQVAYRETIGQSVDYAYTHKKQTGGSGQFGRIAGQILLNGDAPYSFTDETKGGVIPKEFISSIDKGFRQMMEKGLMLGFPVVGVKVTVNDGGAHAVDSSDNAFQEAARGAWREFFWKAKPTLLEPIMKVECEGPVEFHGQIVGTLMQRRGQIVGTHEEAGYTTVTAEVPLADMFGYATVIRSGSQGKAGFTMEFARYSPVPPGLVEGIISDYKKKKEARR